MRYANRATTLLLHTPLRSPSHPDNSFANKSIRAEQMRALYTFRQRLIVGACRLVNMQAGSLRGALDAMGPGLSMVCLESIMPERGAAEAVFWCELAPAEGEAWQGKLNGALASIEACPATTTVRFLGSCQA